MKSFLLLIFAVCVSLPLRCQTDKEFKPSKSQFMVRGYGNTGFIFSDTEGDKKSSFLGPAFSPIFLYKHSDRLLFEAELEFELEDDELEVGLEYADIMYLIAENLSVRAGKFLLPFGTFMERFHPSWINKLPTRPLGFGHDGITPASGVGIELRGVFPLAGPQLNYSIYLTNGPRLNDGSEEPEEAGMLLFENFEDNNLGKAVGGRVGFLPFDDSSMEIGFSVYSANSLGDENTMYEDTGAFLYAFDFSYFKQVSPLKGMINIKAQYNDSQVDTATYLEPHENREEEAYTFENNSNSFYSQLSYRPSMVNNSLIKQLEVVGRFSNFNSPEGSEWEEKTEQFALGLNYWLSWRSVIKLSYQTTQREGGHHGLEDTTANEIFLQWAIGF